MWTWARNFEKSRDGLAIKWALGCVNSCLRPEGARRQDSRNLGPTLCTHNKHNNNNKNKKGNWGRGSAPRWSPIRTLILIRSSSAVINRSGRKRNEEGRKEAALDLISLSFLIFTAAAASVQICQKIRRIGCVILCCKLQCGITQPILQLFWHICSLFWWCCYVTSHTQ